MTRPINMGKRRAWAKVQLAKLAGKQIVDPPEFLKPLLEVVERENPQADTSEILRAYKVAEEKHEGQFRKSGEPFVTHPVAVAKILAELGASGEILQAALLHDTVEDTDYTLEELTEEFGPSVAHMVNGVTKLDKVVYGEAAQAETVRKMLVAMAKDIRVLLIKLADRTHNARTWDAMPADRRAVKAEETIEIFAPLAHRLGISSIKWELEERSFQALYPKVYEEIVRMVQERAPEREKLLKKVKKIIEEDLKTAHVKAQISARNKHYYSIYQKMIGRGKEFDEIYDLMGVRILVDTVSDCYATLGAIHAQWNPIHGRFKDYIAMPKFNMYQSLHTTVVGPEGKPVEIQIRTFDMHERAEFGLAAHWKYKAKNRGEDLVDNKPIDNKWLQSLIDWQNETDDSAEFIDSLKHEIGGTEVYVYTPAGEVKALPADSTPVDFAYAVHTDVGSRTIGARINGKMVPLSTVLNNGDTVQIITSKDNNAGPSRDWLDFVKSARARNKIKQWFSKERRDEYIEQGKSELVKYMRKQNMPYHRLITPEALSVLVDESRYSTLDNIYAALGSGDLQAKTIARKLLNIHGGEEAAEEEVIEEVTPFTKRKQQSSETGVYVNGVTGVDIKLAPCCHPVPGDEIFGFVTQGNGITVHRKACTNSKELMKQKDRLIDVSWSNNDKGTYTIELQVEALDKAGLLSEVVSTLAENKVSITSADVKTSDDRFALLNFVFEMADPHHLESVMKAVRQVDGVFDVYRKNG
ncbi:MAG: bifunctional (p)ppGpp synthetase/guanosine-3',5'-bis(diphosphate) 3'-pyrophosphohydrolase [Micrococcaceae bacterium]